MRLLRETIIELKDKYKDKTDDQLLAILAEKEGISSYLVFERKNLEKVDRQGGDTSDTLDANFSANISEDERKTLAVLAKYESGATDMMQLINMEQKKEGVLKDILVILNRCLSIMEDH